jgi:hypothetical protein
MSSRREFITLLGGAVAASAGSYTRRLKARSRIRAEFDHTSALPSPKV